MEEQYFPNINYAVGNKMRIRISFLYFFVVVSCKPPQTGNKTIGVSRQVDVDIQGVTKSKIYIQEEEVEANYLKVILSNGILIVQDTEPSSQLNLAGTSIKIKTVEVPHPLRSKTYSPMEEAAMVGKLKQRGVPIKEGVKNVEALAKPGTKSRYEYKSPDKNSYIGSEVDENGILSFSVTAKEKERVVTGSQMFDYIIRHHGSEIKEIKGVWGRGLASNRDAFKNKAQVPLNELIAGKKDKAIFLNDIREAAAETWTGKRATEYGFNHPYVNKILLNNDHSINAVHVTFKNKADDMTQLPQIVIREKIGDEEVTINIP